MTVVKQTAGLLWSVRSWGALGLLMALMVTGGAGSGQGTNCITPPSDMVAWWPLDEQPGATSVDDIAPGFNNVGTPHDANGAPTSVSATPGTPPAGPVPVTAQPLNLPSGMVGSALYFYSPYVKVADHPDLNFGTGDFSIDAWIKPVSLVDANFLSLIVHKIDSSGVGYALYTLGNGAGGRELKLVMNGTTYTSSPGITSTNWHHVAVTVKRSSGPPTGTFYINGAPAGTFTPVTANLDNSSPLLIGASFLTGLVGLPNVGRHEFAIDELELFNRALDQSEIQAIFNAGSAGKCKACTAAVGSLDISTGQAGIGILDPNWKLTSAPAGSPPDAFGVTKHPLWVAPPPGSNWISFTTGTAPAGPPGTYIYEISFSVNLNAFQPKLTLQFASDDTSNVFLNSSQLLMTTQPVNAPFQVLYTTSTSPVTSGFVNGSNTLRFEVNNITGGNSATGLLVSGTVRCEPAPSEPTADLGDAPDSTNHANVNMTTYAPTVTASFPTVFDPATGLPQGPKHLQPKGLAWLGPDVSFEDEADQGLDQDPTNNLDFSVTPPVPDKDLKDDGVALPIAIPRDCGQTQFQYTVTSTGATKLYVNVWFDFNRDGDWDDSFKCPLGPATTGLVTEWAVQNQLITVVAGPNFLTTPVFGAANPTKGPDMWMRITLTDQPIAPANGADGSGPASGYKYGETEDYLLRLSYTELCGIKFNDLDGDGKQGSSEPGLANWVIEVKDTNGNFIGYAVTDANGRYCIVVPSPGTYIVSEQQQPGWTQTAPSSGTYTVTVPPAHTNLNFGNRKAGACDLAIKKTVTPSPLVSGQQATVTITVTNVGNAPCPGPTTVTETVPAGLTLVSASGPGWLCVGSTCTYPLPIPANGSVSVTYTFTVTAQPGTAIQNCATASNQNDPNVANNRDCVTTPVVPGAGVCDRQITKTVSPNPVQSGGTVTITITVKNVGTAPCPAVAGVNVADPKPSGMTFNPPVSVTGAPPSAAAGWGCFITGPSGLWPGGLQCTASSPLAPGASVTITFTATVTAPAGSQIQNCAEVTNVGDANQANNKSCVTINVIKKIFPPDLALAKLLDSVLRADQEATYVLRITNVGGEPTTAPMRVTDPLPPQLRFVSAMGEGWSCSASGQNVTCTRTGPLAPSQSGVILLRVRVAAQAGTQITNCATVETAGDANPVNNRGCHTGTVQR